MVPLVRERTVVSHNTPVTLARKVGAPPGGKLSRKSRRVDFFANNARNHSGLDFPVNFGTSRYGLKKNQVISLIFSWRSIHLNFGVGEILGNIVLSLIKCQLTRLRGSRV